MLRRSILLISALMFLLLVATNIEAGTIEYEARQNQQALYDYMPADGVLRQLNFTGTSSPILDAQSLDSPISVAHLGTSYWWQILETKSFRIPRGCAGETRPMPQALVLLSPILTLVISMEPIPRSTSVPPGLPRTGCRAFISGYDSARPYPRLGVR